MPEHEIYRTEIQFRQDGRQFGLHAMVSKVQQASRYCFCRRNRKDRNLGLIGGRSGPGGEPSMKFLAAVFSRGALLALLAAALAACTVVVEEPDPGPRPPRPGPGFCTQEYDPVCGRRGSDLRTFANACLADRADYRIIGRGECRRPRPEPEFCTREYDPVCARRGPERRTFSNPCLADRAGYRVVSRGECRVAEEEPRFCTREYRPVCATRRGNLRTFGNSCEALAADYRIVNPNGPC
jgi:hypothetical protein